MPKEIKKCYNFLDLDYDATKEEIDIKYNQLIDKISVLDQKSQIKYEKKRKKIENAYNLIQNFINQYGTNHKKRRNISISDLLMLAGILILLLISLLSLFDRLI